MEELLKRLKKNDVEMVIIPDSIMNVVHVKFTKKTFHQYSFQNTTALNLDEISTIICGSPVVYDHNIAILNHLLDNFLVRFRDEIEEKMTV